MRDRTAPDVGYPAAIAARTPAASRGSRHHEQMSRDVRSSFAASPPRRNRPAAREETPCNLCGASTYVVVGTRDRDGLPLRTVLCTACGMVWTNPRPTAADMNAYYETSYRADYKGHRAPPLRKIVRGFLGAADRRRLLRQFDSRRLHSLNQEPGNDIEKSDESVGVSGKCSRDADCPFEAVSVSSFGLSPPRGFHFDAAL